MKIVGGLDSVLDLNIHGKERGEAIDHLFLEWLYRFRYSTVYVLVRLKTATEGLTQKEKDALLRTEFSKRNPDQKEPEQGQLFKSVCQSALRQKLKKMEKTGLIRKFELYVGRVKFGYRLTKKGAQKLQKNSDHMSIDPRNLTGAISNTKAAHCIAEQLILVNKIAHSVKVGVSIKYATEKELSKTRDMRGVKRPDLLIEQASRITAYEAELTHKSNSEIHKILARNKEFIESGKAQEIKYYVSNPIFKEKFERCYKNKNGLVDIPIYKFNDRAKKWIKSNETFQYNFEKIMNFIVTPDLKEFM
jgi:DNA-binding Lrp family transcriptional regulator